MTQKSVRRKIIAWCVHGYTALGLVAAAGMAWLLAAEHTSPASFHWAFVLMLVATLIDATDGTLARWIRVKEVVPSFDGRRLDDLTDFLTYTCLPLCLIWRADILSPTQSWWLLLPLLASAYGFCQVSAKTTDGYFLGFPSYWNIVAFYLYFLRPPEWLALALLIGLALLTFVPSRYLYPSQRGRLNRVTNILGAGWAGCVAGILLINLSPDAQSSARWNDENTRQLVFASMFFPAYYLVASWTISVRKWLLSSPR